ncbi:MAG: PLDc_N domain-containing protein [Candidatus Omnitrophica bacterium]|nr:PLDc_N domain-containing protein [Candidatus Omnitrophota bacterium]
MEFLITAFIVIFNVVAIVDAIRTRLSIEKKLLWIALIIFVPIIGVMLYFLLGRPETQTA